MKLSFSILFLTLLSSLSSVLALPHDSIEARAATKDPAFSVSKKTMAESITCPNGTDGKGGIVFLVHGTGSSGEESWSFGPYATILPTAGKGFSICWIDLPNRSQGDVQLSGEYVAYGIEMLSKKSKTKKLNIIGHSQGNLNIQFALNYFPSTRSKVNHFISLAGDLHGIDVGPLPLLCDAGDLLQAGCTPATRQQKVGSNFLKALLKRGDRALVPTLSLYTRYDEVIGGGSTARLPGAENVAIQDPDVCGPLALAEHFTMLVEPASFALAMTKIVPGAEFSKSYCNNYIFGSGYDKKTASKLVATVKGVVLDLVSFVTSDFTKAEPALKPYVCEAGDAKKKLCA